MKKKKKDSAKRKWEAKRQTKIINMQIWVNKKVEEHFFCLLFFFILLVCILYSFFLFVLWWCVRAKYESKYDCYIWMLDFTRNFFRFFPSLIARTLSVFSNQHANFIMWERIKKVHHNGDITSVLGAHTRGKMQNNLKFNLNNFFYLERWTSHCSMK